MPWYSKEQPTPLDATQITGLSFLDGNGLAQEHRQSWIEGKKYPLITFPSGLTRECQQHSNPDQPGMVHIFGALALPYQSTRDAAYDQAQAAAAQFGIQVAKQTDMILTVTDPRTGRGYHIHYDNDAGQMVDITRFPETAMELLDGESRALLPELYSNERLGLEAVAPLKFFTPTSSWTWYPTEFDGKDLFFGLVSGFEVELGYFALSELESIGGGLILPVERDLYFQSRSLRELKQMHEQDRY